MIHGVKSVVRVSSNSISGGPKVRRDFSKVSYNIFLDVGDLTFLEHRIADHALRKDAQ